jgi:uncharacterized protein
MNLFYYFLLSLSLLLFSGCSSDEQLSSDNIEDFFNDAQRTTLGTRTSKARNNPALTTNTNSKWSHYKRDPLYTRMKTQALQYISMPDGTQLGVLVTLPADTEGNTIADQFPVILTQTAYNIHLASLTSPIHGTSMLLGAADPFFVQRGYAMVAVDVVGTGVSSGKWRMFNDKEQEGYRTAVNWIKQQPWFNGNIAVAGTSYLGISALLTASQQHPEIKAVFANVPAGDPFRSAAATGGLLNMTFVGLWLSLTQFTTTFNDIIQFFNPERADLINTATTTHAQQTQEYFVPLLNSALEGNPELIYDNDFWIQRSPMEKVSNIEVPTFIMGALHDIFQRDAPLLYEQLKNTVNTKLIITDGAHMQSILTSLSATGMVPPIANIMLQWFDQYVMGMDTSAASIPNVTQFVKNYRRGWFNPDSYVTSTDWPHPAAQAQRWYLHQDMSIDNTPPTTEEGRNTVVAQETVITNLQTFFDDQNFLYWLTISDDSDCSQSLVQWTLGASGLLPKPCYTDNSFVETDALNYETDIFKENYYINGPIQADIWLSTTATEAVLSVRVDEVDMFTGRINPISNGLLVASNRAVDTGRSRYLDGDMIQPWRPNRQSDLLPVIPNQVMKLSVEVFPTSAIIRRGNKLRISIDSSNQVQGVLHNELVERTKGGINAIHHSADYPSSIVFSAVPLSELN